IGSIIHDLIKDTLTAYSRGEAVFPTADELKEKALQAMRSGWRDSVNQVWKQYPKKTNLFELYYGDGKHVPKEETDAIKERVLECVDNFANSAVVRTIKSVPFLNWKPIDTLDTFQIDDLKVWCAVDFAYTDPDGVLHIIDWKTGSEKKDALRFQLGCYALYALEKWFTPIEKTAPHGVFLYDGARMSDFSVDAALLVSVKDQILTSAQAMKAKLKDVANNVAEEEDFPCNPNEYNCRSCNFREVCPAVNGSL
ncbi:MAG: PD-(D/E)XK nuclease family protein, partial [Victivallales bacterium]|nr:PD-(D/E)XK nuclease family protein [Victivallales bacterium]